MASTNGNPREVVCFQCGRRSVFDTYIALIKEGDISLAFCTPWCCVEHVEEAARTVAQIHALPETEERCG